MNMILGSALCGAGFVLYGWRKEDGLLNVCKKRADEKWQKNRC